MLLKLLDLEGKVITIDAMGRQASIADQIVERGGHYILALKGNQEKIHEEEQVIFTGGTSSVTNVDLPEVHMKEACEIDKGHGKAILFIKYESQC